MRAFNVPGNTPQKVGPGFTRSEKRRLLFMGLGLVFILSALGVAVMKRNAYLDQRSRSLPLEDSAMAETVLLPDIDVNVLDTLVRDERQVDRVVLEDEALDYLLERVRTMTPRHFEAMETEELDAAKIAAIEADPAAYRGNAYMARGWIQELRTRQRGATGQQEHIGRLILEDDSVVYFLTLDVGALEQDSFARVDGIFLKFFSDENAQDPGQWIDGPLLVGPEVLRSYPDYGTVSHLEPGYLIDVSDADLLGEEPRIVRESPFDALWHLMAFSRDMPADAIDWEAAPLLNNATLMSIVDNPAEWRGAPVRIPISRIQDARVLRATENPARIENFTQGWIGNTTWKNVVFFKYPHANYDVKLRDHVTGRGFFLHNFAYESAGKGLRIAPVFVLQELERFNPKPDPIFMSLGYGIAGVAVLLICLFVILLARDKRKSEGLQREIARRRRARQAAAGSMGTATR